MSKRVETSKEPIKDTQMIKDPITDDTHIVDRCRYLQDGPTNMDPVLTRVGIIGQRGPRTISGGSISQIIIRGGESIICSNIIMYVLTNSSEMTLESNCFTFDPLKVQTLVIAPFTEPLLTSDRDVRTTSIIGASRPNHSRIGTPFMNKDISSGCDVLSTVRSDVGETDKLNTAVQRSLTDKRNTAPSKIEEGSPKIIFTEIIEESNSSERMNLANSLGVHTPKLVSFRHLPMQTDNVGHWSDGSVATKVVDQDSIWRPTDRDVRTAPMHGDVETMSEKLVYRKFINDSEFETREVFERESIENIGTQLETTRLDNKMTRSVDSSLSY